MANLSTERKGQLANTSCPFCVYGLFTVTSRINACHSDVARSETSVILALESTIG